MDLLIPPLLQARPYSFHSSRFPSRAAGPHAAASVAGRAPRSSECCCICRGAALPAQLRLCSTLGAARAAAFCPAHGARDWAVRRALCTGYAATAARRRSASSPRRAAPSTLRALPKLPRNGSRSPRFARLAVHARDYILVAGGNRWTEGLVGGWTGWAD